MIKTFAVMRNSLHQHHDQTLLPSWLPCGGWLQPLSVVFCPPLRFPAIVHTQPVQAKPAPVKKAPPPPPKSATSKKSSVREPRNNFCQGNALVNVMMGRWDAAQVKSVTGNNALGKRTT